MEPGEDQYEAELADAVMQYLVQHPQAMDNVEGIAEWWVAPETKADREVMRRVLDRLCERGLVEGTGSGNRSYYRLKKAVKDERSN